MIAEFIGTWKPFSNFHKSPFTAPPFGAVVPPPFGTIASDPPEWDCVERYYQAAKATEQRRVDYVWEAAYPKRAGYEIELRPDWEEVKEDAMARGLWFKFEDPQLRSLLLSSGDQEIQEGNWHRDSEWGRIWDRETGDWIGQNKLGVLLMELRAELAHDQPCTCTIACIPQGLTSGQRCRLQGGS